MPYKSARAMSKHTMEQRLPGEKINKVDLHEGLFLSCVLFLDQSRPDTALYTELDGDQPVVFYYVDPGYAMERFAEKTKLKINCIINMSERSHGRILECVPLDVYMIASLFKRFKKLLEMQFHCATSILQIRQDVGT